MREAFGSEWMLWTIIALWASGYIIAHWLPGRIYANHQKEQLRLPVQCRALFLIATEHVEAGSDRAGDCLKRIRRIESKWRFGRSRSFRLAKFASTIGITTLAGSAVFWLLPLFSAIEKGFAKSDFGVIGVFSVFIGLRALTAAASATKFLEKDQWTVDDCGDRLERLMSGPRALAPRPDQDGPDGEVHRNLDGLTPCEIFGLGPSFTQRQLDNARRRLARDLHPDLWNTAAPSKRRANEEALKRVNAAYDELSSVAS